MKWENCVTCMNYFEQDGYPVFFVQLLVVGDDSCFEKNAQKENTKI